MKKVIFIIMIILVCSTAIFAQANVGFANGPAILTSIGQSADYEMIRVLLTRSGIQFDLNVVIRANELSSAYNTLILVIGGSSKGLGDAGISADEELVRTQALIARARELNMSIIAVHIGGEARRGALSDVFISYAVPLTDFVIVVAEGNNDGLFTNLANQARIPFNSVNRISEVSSPLAAAFR